MLHKAAHSFSPFKLQHLHSHIRSALNLNLGQNAGQNFNQASSSGAASSSASSSALGGPAAQAGGAGGNAKYHAGRSYSHYVRSRSFACLSLWEILADDRLDGCSDNCNEPGCNAYPPYIYNSTSTTARLHQLPMPLPQTMAPPSRSN